MSSTSSSPSPEVRAALGAATRPDDGGAPDWVRRAHERSGRHRARRHGPRVVSVPQQLVEGRRSVSRSAVTGVLAVVVLVALVGGVRVAWAVHDSQPEVLERPTDSALVEEGPPAGSSPSEGSPSESATSQTATAEPELVVHVAGQVERPGIVRLGPGDRVVDALEAAGGVTAEADLSAVNLARPVVDGEQVYVPLPGEIPPVPAPGGGAGAGAGGTAAGPIDLNSADVHTLDTLPGVGPVLAERIVAWRTEHGRFTTVDELAEVSGIGETMLSRIRDKVRVTP